MGMFGQQVQVKMMPKDWQASPDMLGALMGTSDYLGANLSQGFDDSIAGSVSERLQIHFAAPNKRKGERIGNRGRMPLFAPSPDAMSEEDWKKSEYYREGLDFDKRLSPLQHAKRAEFFDARKIREVKLASYEPSTLEVIAGFGAGIAGASASPETFIPMGGLALRGVLAARAAKSGLGASASRVAADMGAGAIEGAAGAAMALPIVAAHRGYMGDPMTVAEMSMDLILSSFGGAVLSGIGGAVARKINPDLTTTIYQKKQVIADMARAQKQYRVTGEIPEPSEETLRILEESQQMARAVDEVANNPLGNPDDPLVRITPKDIEATIVERGAFKDLTGVEVKGSGYGLVKFIWKHGNKSTKPPHKQITREDIINFPHVIRFYEAQEVTVARKGRRQKTQARQWIVQRDDGEWVVYADAPFTKTDGKRRVVTIHVLNEEERLNFTLSERKKITPAASPIGIVAPKQDTNQNTYYRADEGRQGEPQEVASNNSVAQSEAERNALMSETELMQLIENGELDAEDRAALEIAQQRVSESEMMAKAYEAAAVCIAGKA